MGKGSIVLDEDSPREEFIESMEELGFKLTEEREGNNETVPYVSIWNSPDEKARIRYVEEPGLGTL